MRDDGVARTKGAVTLFWSLLRSPLLGVILNAGRFLYCSGLLVGADDRNHCALIKDDRMLIRFRVEQINNLLVALAFRFAYRTLEEVGLMAAIT